MLDIHIDIILYRLCYDMLCGVILCVYYIYTDLCCMVPILLYEYVICYLYNIIYNIYIQSLDISRPWFNFTRSPTMFTKKKFIF